MNAIRFNPVFISMLALSALCAFALPARVTARVRANVAVLFYPIARPTSIIAGAVRGRLSPEKAIDDGAAAENATSGTSTAESPRVRSAESILQENQELRVLVASLQGQMIRLAEHEAQRQSVGEARQWCEPFRVSGAVTDIASRELLHLAGTTGQGLRDGQPVLYGGATGGGIAGRIDRASMAGSMLRLVTDRGCTATVSFARFVKDPATGKIDFVRIIMPPVLATGDGRGAMWIRNLTLQQKDQAGIVEGDWAILDDNEWPDDVQYYRVGRVTSVKQYATGPGYAEIKVEPPLKLLNLREVLVMTKRN